MTTSRTDAAATWQDADLEASARLDALIAEMSLAEKLAQLGSVWLGFDVVTGEVAPFSVHTDRLSFTGRSLERIVEPGEVTFRVGTAGATFAGPLSAQLVGETRTITGERVMDTPVEIS
jgi:hypothetical protein